MTKHDRRTTDEGSAFPKAQLIALAAILAILIVAALSFKGFIVSDDTRTPEFSAGREVSKDINYLWQEKGSGFPGHTQIVNLPHHAMVFVLGLFLTPGIVQKTIVAIMFVFAGLGMFVLARYLTKNDNGAFFAALFYCINIFAITTVFTRSYVFYMFPYAFTPLLLWSVLKILREDDRRNYLIAGVLLFLNLPSISNPAYLIIEFIPIAVFAGYHLLITEKRGAALKKAGVYALLFLLINAIWIMPIIYSLAGSFTNVSASQARQVGFQQRYIIYGTPLNNFRLISWPWHYNPPYHLERNIPSKEYFTNSGLINTYLFLPALFLCALLLIDKRRKEHAGVYILALGTILLASGLSKPFGQIHPFLSANLPVYGTLFNNMYSKFGFILSLCYSLVFGIFFAEASRALPSKEKALTVIFIILLVPLTIPFLSREIVPDYARITVPESYFEGAALLNGIDGSAGIVSLPKPQQNNFAYTTWGYYGAGFQDSLFDKPVYSLSYSVENHNDEVMIRGIYANYQNRSFSDLKKQMHMLNARYVVFHKDYNITNSTEFTFNKQMLQIYASDEIDIYELNGTAEHAFYAPRKLAYAENASDLGGVMKAYGPGDAVVFDRRLKIGPQNATAIAHIKRSTTRHEVTIDSSSDTMVLVWAQSFNPLWKAEIPGYGELKDHFIVNFNQNGWLINSTDVCRTISNASNGTPGTGTSEDLSEDLSEDRSENLAENISGDRRTDGCEYIVDIRFRPRTSFLIGAAISLLSLAACIVAFILLNKKGREENG